MRHTAKASIHLHRLSHCLWTALCASSAHAAGLPADMHAATINLTASLHSMAVACGDLTQATLESQRQLQRAAALKQMGISGADYDELYEQSALAFEQKWSRSSDAQKKQSCAQVKALSKAAPK
jgi:hypothetical protein